MVKHLKNTDSFKLEKEYQAAKRILTEDCRNMQSEHLLNEKLVKLEKAFSTLVSNYVCFFNVYLLIAFGFFIRKEFRRKSWKNQKRVWISCMNIYLFCTICCGSGVNTQICWRYPTLSSGVFCLRKREIMRRRRSSGSRQVRKIFKIMKKKILICKAMMRKKLLHLKTS